MEKDDKYYEKSRLSKRKDKRDGVIWTIISDKWSHLLNKSINNDSKNKERKKFTKWLGDTQHKTFQSEKEEATHMKFVDDINGIIVRCGYGNNTPPPPTSHPCVA